MTDKEAENAVKLYSDMVYRIAYARMLDHADAEDVYQEVFLRYIRKDPVFSGEEHRKAWFIRVTVNCAAKCAKRRGRSVPLEEISPPETREPDTEKYADLRNALKSLPPKYREVIHLFYFCDMPVEKIAGILRRPRSTVTVQLTRARKMLKKLLEEDKPC